MGYAIGRMQFKMNIDMKIKEASKLSGIDLIQEDNIIHRGANKEVICVRSKKEGRMALKYFKNGNEKSRKCQKEALFLTGCKKNEIDCVPEYKWHDESHGFLLETWLDGENLKRITYKEIPKISSFIERLALTKKENWNLDNASDSMVNTTIYIKRIEEKSRLIFRQDCNNEAVTYLIDKIKKKYKILVENNLRNAEYAFKDERWMNTKSIIMPSPSDIGIHNMRIFQGKLKFFDFEHSGWDRPEKLYGDLLTRPGNFHSWEEEKNCRKDIQMQANLYGKYFRQRLIDILPTIQLKWIIIMMDKNKT